MDLSNRPRRSALFVPGSKPRAAEKARGLPADVVMLDLEDAVAPAEKASARAFVAGFIKQRPFGRRELVVRVNEPDTVLGAEDLKSVASSVPDAVLLPKVSSTEIVDQAAKVLDQSGASETQIWTMIETPGGILAASKIAAHPKVTCLIAGTNDLSAELRAAPGPDRAELALSLQMIVLAARAAGVTALDGVYNAFSDTQGLAGECRQGRALGFDGKTLIHPSQIAVANEAFAPDPDALELAQRQIAVYEQAKSDGQGIAVLDGKIVENLHVAAAQRLMAQWEAIKALSSTSESN
ncbi:MAG: CoA ester lyase [Pseudomonadota bacterium]